MKRFMFLKKRLIRDNAGFTLIEALFGLLVFSVGILATASMQTSSLNSDILARQTTEAATLAASVIENLHRLDYEKDAELTTGTHILPAQDQYNLSYTIQRDSIIDNTMLIQVTVNWSTAGKPRTVSMVSMIPDII